MRALVSRLPIWACLPIVVVQGLRVRRTTLRLAEADGVTGVAGNGDSTTRLAVIGDSLAAGVGIDHHRDAVAGHLATRLAEQRGARVEWTVTAQSGLTAGGISALIADLDLTDADVVFLSVGVNDTKDLHTRARWRRELSNLLDQILTRAPRADVLLLGVPPMEHFPALPAPLAAILGARAARIDAAAGDVLAARPRVRRVGVEFAQAVGSFAEDGFHPGPSFHALIAEACLDQLSRRAAPRR